MTRTQIFALAVLAYLTLATLIYGAWRFVMLWNGGADDEE